MQKFTTVTLIVIAAGCIGILIAHLRRDPPSDAPVLATVALDQICGTSSVPLVAFGPDSKLFAACRTEDSGKVSTKVAIIIADPRTGKLLDKRTFPVPTVELPRRSDVLMVSPNGQLLVYAELHKPEFMVVVGTPSLEQIGEATESDWLENYGEAKMVGVNQDGDGIFVAAADHDLKRGWHLIGISPSAPKKVQSDRLMPFHENTSTFAVDIRSSSVWWINHLDATQYEVGTDKKLRTVTLGQEFWSILEILFSKSTLIAFSSTEPGSGTGRVDQVNYKGRITSRAQTKCSVSNADLTSDGVYLVALCEKTGNFEPDFGKVLSREALVFRVNGLEKLASLPVSRANLHERASSTEVPWTAWPIPAAWHGGGVVLVAIPTFGSVDLFSVADSPN